jgi:drug/metabolite transporter (DMT)-like permease
MTPRAWLLFTLCAVIWGVPYLFIKIAVDAGVAPAFVAWARITLAALLLLPLALRRGVLRGLRARSLAIVGYTATETAVPFVLTAAGERYIASSLTAILIAAMPLMVALLSLRFIPGERLTRTRVVGLVLGFAGVVALLGIDIAGRGSELLGSALVLMATLCYALATIIVSRRLTDLDPFGPVTASLLLGAVALLPVGLATLPAALPAPGALWAIIILGVVCTAIGLLAYFRLIAVAGASRAAVVTYVNPVVAVVAGVVALGEHIGVVSIVGLALILLGSWIATGGSHPA